MCLKVWCVDGFGERSDSIHVSRYVSKIIMLTTSVEAICLNYRPKKDNTYPLMLRLTKSGKRKYVSLGLSVEERFWDFKKNSPKRNCPDREAILSVIERKSKQYREQITQFKVEGKDYTLETLVQRVENPVRQMNFGEYLDYLIQQLKDENRLGYAESFKGLKSSLILYCDNLDFQFTHIDQQWLKGYEMFLIRSGKKENTIGIRFRSLRVLYNKAISEKLVKREYYPFDDFKVSKFHEQTMKRAISKEDIKRIIELDLRTVTTYHSPYLSLGRDLFLFSYLSCGINLTDMARIRYCDIFEGRLSYYRQKTGKLISFQLQPLALDIIGKYRKPDATPNDYVFPILDRKVHKTAVQIRDKVRKANKATNKALHKIGEKLGIPIDLTTYVARHSYATVLKRSGVSTAIISESLGHSSEKVTQIYLDSFENSQIDEAMKNLL